MCRSRLYGRYRRGGGGGGYWLHPVLWGGGARRRGREGKPLESRHPLNSDSLFFFLNTPAPTALSLLPHPPRLPLCGGRARAPPPTQTVTWRGGCRPPRPPSLHVWKSFIRPISAGGRAARLSASSSSSGWGVQPT